MAACCGGGLKAAGGGCAAATIGVVGRAKLAVWGGVVA